MFKVLPQMHRLAEQVCAAYSVEVAAVVTDAENVGAPTAHYPYYIVRLAANRLNWTYLCCRPHKGKLDFSMSTNNVDVVVHTLGPDMGGLVVLPSWRGKLLTDDELRFDSTTYKRRFYMLTEACADLIENALIAKHEETGLPVHSLLN
ncbi:MAG: hypothetical protein II590_01750 [Clostridia bacterium]|nr:hypothetical protein [Clostridia bacterium]